MIVKESTSECDRLLLLTVDSCRLDVAVEAHTPVLDSVSGLTPGLAQATFTLPAHMALFSGFPPVDVMNGRNSSSANVIMDKHTRKSTSSAYVSWVEQLRRAGYRTVGAADMRWFEEDVLRRGFDVFLSWAPAYRAADFGLPTWERRNFAITHAAELALALEGSDRWLVFVNAGETHAPYLGPASLLREQRKYAFARNGKVVLKNESRFLSLMADLRQCQVAALEEMDSRLQRLIDSLPKPFELVVCADHGESFGEEGVWGHVRPLPHVMKVPIWTGRVE